MSAYGSISAPVPKASLEPLVFPLKSGTLSTYPISAADAPKELVEYLYQVFAKEVEDGKTYPQEGVIDYDAFFTYFFATASSTIIGIVHPASSEITSAPATIEEARGGRSWQECVGGCYYIKPNYPGRASHNCNAGFIVPPSGRGNGSGGGLAKSFLTYAPALGYRASVFNLVFENNIASLRLWERLGFEKVGRIPQAGRLKTGPGGAEEYVDAIIIYKSFV